MEYTLNEIELIDICLNAIYDRPATHLGSKFTDIKERRRIQALMENENLIDLVEGSSVDKSALITSKGKMIMVTHRSFKKYLEYELARENEIKRKETTTEALVERATQASEKSAKYEGLNIYIGLALLVVSIFAAWQTSKANDKDRVIEIQKQHIQQLESQLHSIQ